MITVTEAERIIRAQTRDYGSETVAYLHAQGRVLAENLFADRDLPPFNRAMVDGVAIRHDGYRQRGQSFKISGTQAAGDNPLPRGGEGECIEIMTGAALDPTFDTVIRYEDVRMSDGLACIELDEVRLGQHVHLQGSDKKQGDLVATAHSIVTPALIGLAASIGKTALRVKKLPRVATITTGDELVSAEDTPSAFQIRRSNGVTIGAVLQRYGLTADWLHLADDEQEVRAKLAQYLQEYDILLMSGGVSKGKFDYIPGVLQGLGTEKLFHGILQKPGKPFWFGRHARGTLIFAFPGNPVSTFMCLHRYFVPWLEQALGLPPRLPEYALLQEVVLKPIHLQCFVQVNLRPDEGARLQAIPVASNNSGDFSQLSQGEAFMELPSGKSRMEKDEICRIWRYNN